MKSKGLEMIPKLNKSELIESDHDLLIRITTLVEEIKKNLENHLETHRKREIVLFSIALGAVITGFFSMLAVVVK
jgi:hypothetical protein